MGHAELIAGFPITTPPLCFLPDHQLYLHFIAADELWGLILLVTLKTLKLRVKSLTQTRDLTKSFTPAVQQHLL